MKQTNENLKATKMLTDMQAIQSGATTSNIAADTRLKDAMLGEAKKKEAVAILIRLIMILRLVIISVSISVIPLRKCRAWGGKAPVGKVTIPGQ